MQPIRIDRSASQRMEQIVCPECELPYFVDAGRLGRDGKRVRCPKCKSVWFAPAISRADGDGTNPLLQPEFPWRLKLYLNGLPEAVKRNSPKSTHAIKTFLMREGVGEGAIGFANGIKVNLENVKPTEFLWDAVGKIPNLSYPGEDADLTFVAESENQIDINKIIEDANKLPIARADVRLMFFRANDGAQCNQFFDRLSRLFSGHRKSEPDDVYIIAGMDMQTLNYAVRRLTLQRAGSNVDPWEEF